jgi:citrate lyase subunit beta/citryl-CoA lyase
MKTTSLALMRSKLFVPGSRPELFAKALGSAADALSLDLEDAVTPDRKAEAREAVAGFLRGLPTREAGAGRGKIMIVRVNGLATPLFEPDLQAITGPGLDVVNLPMAESAEDIRAAVAALEQAERKAGLTRPIGLLANIETPLGLRRAAEIATAHPRLSGLQIGYGDLFEPAAIARDCEPALDHVRLLVRFAAAEARIPCFDGSLAAVASPERCRAEAEAARRLGYAGKSCIHPSQVAIVNAIFAPSPAEIARARKVLDAAHEQIGRGTGAFVVDGQMVDAPFIASAQAVVDLARQLGMAVQEH